MLQMTAQLIAERVEERAFILVLGAGGGLEIEHFSEYSPSWRYLAVDPDPAMLAAAQEKARECDAFERVTWISGRIGDAPLELVNAGACLLTLHFVPDNGEKLATLKGIRARLSAGAPFVLVDLCLDKVAPDYQLRLDRYYRFSIDSGAPMEQAASTRERVRNVIPTVSPERNLQLLGEAGYSGVEPFYAGLSWRGWVAYA